MLANVMPISCGKEQGGKINFFERLGEILCGVTVDFATISAKSRLLVAG
ncbi:Hypothetical protein SmN45_1818 [Serratia marcescens]|nr:Hypothetical protein SmN45_1818 [Serratia marcescens]